MTAGPEASRSLLAGEVRAAGAECALQGMCLFYLSKFEPLQLEPLLSDTLSFSPKRGHVFYKATLSAEAKLTNHFSIWLQSFVAMASRQRQRAPGS